MPDFSRDIDIGYPLAPIDIVISLLGTVVTTLWIVIETVKESTVELWEELVSAREWSTVLNEEITSRLDSIRAEAGVNVVNELQTFHEEFAGLILALPIDAVLAELKATRAQAKDTGDELLSALETGREWDWELTDQIIEKLETIKLANEATEAGVVGQLDVVNSSILAANELAALIISTMSSEMAALRTTGTDIGDMIVSKLQESQDWSWEMTDQIVTQLEALRLTNKTAGEDIVSKLGTVQAAGTLAAVQGADILSELQSLGLSANEIDTALLEAIEELKRIRRIQELTLGEEVES